MVLKGTINNYHLSFKDVICITGIPRIILNILGNGNLTDISLNKIYLIPFFNNFKKNELINLKKENYNQYISKLEGNINILNSFNKGINSINIPNFHIKTNIINHNLSILGSLYYDNMNNVKIPKIVFFSGKNKGFITGKISKKININSSINANHLDYFIPNLKGTIIATLNIYGFYSSPNIYSILTGEKLNWKNILYLNNIKMLININSQTNLTKSIFIIIKKIKLFKLHLDFLKLNFFWNHANQKFSLILKNKYLTMNSIINGKFDYQKKIWEGNFKKINIFTFNKIWILNKNKNVFSNNTNVKINKKNTIKYQFSILSLIYKIKKKIFPYILNSSINFETNLFFKAKFISKKNKKNCKIKIFLYSNNIKIKKNIKDIIFTKKISSFKLCIYFEGNNIITQWSMHVLKNKTDKLFGYLNIYDYFKKANIQGKYFLFNFPCSILNFFISNTTRLKGFANGNIKILGAIYYPYISANLHLKKFYIESNKILKHIVLFFYPSFNLIKYIKINQTIFIKEGDILFKLNSNLRNNILNPIVWSIIFDSKQVIFFVLPKIQLNLSSKLNLRYFISKYDLIGYLKSCLFYFEFNEKNFIF